MRIFQISILSVLTLTLYFTGSAKAEDTAYYSVGVGYYGVLDNKDSAADLRFEYRSEYSFLADDLHPWAGAEINSDASLWAGAGLYYDWNIAPNFYLAPSFGVGYYAKGSSDKDLDYPVEFRSQIEADYQLEDKSRVGVSFGHISNASLGDHNPGTEIVNFYYHVPTDSFFRLRKP